MVIDKKLTPRVGDRVLVRSDRTYVGDVRYIDEGSQAFRFGVAVDGYPGVIDWFPLNRLTVVDREPVEWPEGWKRWAGSHRVYDRISGHTFSQEAIRRCLEFGPDMLARWDELMGGDE